MSEKQEHQFPENWKNISSEEAIKHIKYLLEHYQEYDMRKFGNNGIVINEIYFFPVVISLQHGATFKYMDINWQKVHDSTEDIYPMIQQLIDVCNVEINKRKTEEVINAAKKAKKQRKASSFIMRGNIYDRNGIKLATDTIYYDIFARKDDFVHSPEELAKILAPILKISQINNQLKLYSTILKKRVLLHPLYYKYILIEINNLSKYKYLFK